MQPIIGTTNAGRVKDSCQASNVNLTRPEWYEIYLAAGNKLP
jgi:predicted oxidoreductase